MLPWIQVYSNLPEHPKIYALVDRLKLRRNSEAVGIVVSLWLWAAKNAPDGDLSGFPDRAIAAAVGYSAGFAPKICAVLVECGWLDSKSSGGYLIHDWEDYAALLMEVSKKQKQQGKARVARYRKKFFTENDAAETESPLIATKIDNSSSKCNAKISVTQVKCNAENAVTDDQCNAPTRPDQTEPNHNSLSESSSSWSKEKLSALFSPRLALSESAMEELLSLTDGMEEAVVRRALDIAQDNGKLVWGYVKGILKNWKSCGIRTLSQVEEREAKRKGRGGQAAANAGSTGVGAAEVAESRRRMREILEE